MSHQHATLGDTVYFWFAANDTSGSGGDGATPLFDVREAGAAAGDIPLLSGTPTLLTHANYPAGCYEIAVAATAGNGFAANDVFAVFCTLAIDSQNPTGFVGSCSLSGIRTLLTGDAYADTQTLLGRLTAARAGYLDNLNGHVAQTGDSFARIGATGSGLTSLLLAANVPANFADLAITVTTGRVDVASIEGGDATDAINAACDTAIETYRLDEFFTAVLGSQPTAGSLLGDLTEDDAGTQRFTTNALEQGPSGGGGAGLTPLAEGTAQGGAAGSIQLAAASTFADDELNGNVVKILSGTGAGQARVITDYTGATDTATVTPNWTTTPDATSVYEVVEGSVNITAVSNVAEDIATATALATVDTNVGTLNTNVPDIISLAAINAEVDTALNTAIPGSPTANSINERIAAIDDLTQAAGAGDLAAILVDTGTTIQNLITGLNDLSAAQVNAEVDNALNTAIPGTPTAGSINDVLRDLDALLPGAGTLSVLNAAAVNAEVVDALVTDVYAQATGAPGSGSVSIATMLTWIFTLSNLPIESDAGAIRLRNATDTATLATATQGDDDTTYQRDLWA